MGEQRNEGGNSEETTDGICAPSSFQNERPNEALPPEQRIASIYESRFWEDMSKGWVRRGLAK